MALAQNNPTYHHFTHPQHPLVKLQSQRDYICDGCETNGSGTRFTCSSGCDFDLHEFCAQCPKTLRSHIHTHPLTLLYRKPQSRRQIERYCDLCEDPIEALFYRCKDCDFNAHPLCTQLPRSIRHALHRAHPLHLLPPSDEGAEMDTRRQVRPALHRTLGHNYRCPVCPDLCTSWRYGCRGCGFNVHLDCALLPPPRRPPMNTERSIAPHTRQPRLDDRYPCEYGPAYSPMRQDYARPNNFNRHELHNRYPCDYGPAYSPMRRDHARPNNFNGMDQCGGSNGGRIGNRMFAIVGQLALGVLAHVVFGESDLYFESLGY